MVVSHSSLNPLTLDKTCSLVVCPDIGTPCVLQCPPRDLVAWCMILSEVMCAAGTFVPGPPPWEVAFSRLMCSGVREPRMARRAGLGVTLLCLPAGAGGLVGPVCLAPGPPNVWLVGKGGQAEGQVSVGAPLSFLDADSFRGCGERAPRNILAGHVR